MRLSQLFARTLREAPAEADASADEADATADNG